MKKVRTLFLGMVIISAHNSYAQDFYIHTISGSLRGQVKYFTSLASSSSDGWDVYEMTTLDRKNIQLLMSHRYKIHCGLGRAFVARGVTPGEGLANTLLDKDSRHLQGEELSSVLGPACKI